MEIRVIMIYDALFRLEKLYFKKFHKKRIVINYSLETSLQTGAFYL